MNDTIHLEPGDPAPEFTLPNEAGTQTSLSDYSGQRVLVYFYPKADTPGCTTEACDFRDAMEQLSGATTQVIGISPDSVESLKKFRDNHSLNFPLLSDPDKTVMKQWGAFGEKKNYGKIVQGVIRSTFLVNEDGIIEWAKYNVKATNHVARVLRDLDLDKG